MPISRSSLMFLPFLRRALSRTNLLPPIETLERYVFSFQQKNALIIGAGHNIGRAVALEFARRGARVAVADLDLGGAEETAGLILEAGGEALGIQCDATDEASIAAAIDLAEQSFDAIDVHMNNAGILHSGNPE